MKIKEKINMSRRNNMKLKVKTAMKMQCRYCQRGSISNVKEQQKTK